jgi:hypothetical protein
MSRFPLLAVVLGLLATGCGSDDAVIPPTTVAPPTRVVFTATLSPAQENPPITNADQTGTGTVSATMNMTRDSSGNITAATIDFVATMSGFPPNTTLTLAHIHPGALGVNGPALISTQIVAGDVPMPNGSGTLNKPGIPVTPVDTANQLLNNPSGYYFNIHTSLNPGGAARGQLARTQ